MGRWSQYDTDEERLPSGMVRIGYDADDQTYTFRDADGSIWESAPGSQYSGLHRISGPPAPLVPRDSYDDRNQDDDDAALLEPPPPYILEEPEHKASWRAEMMPLFNFFMIIALFLIGVFFYLRATAGKMDREMERLKCGEENTVHTVHMGETCWGIANTRGTSVDVILRENPNLECNKLVPGQTICVPPV